MEEATGGGRALFEPVTGAERIASLDVLRGVGLLGILLLNITGFGLPWAYENPTIAGGAEGANLAVWAVNNVLFEGTMRGIFSMLFGAGVILLTRRAAAKQAEDDIADIYHRRNLWLVLFGVLHAYILLWPGEILYYYGVIGLFLYPFRRLGPRGLILVAAALLLLPMPLNALGYFEAVEQRAEAIEIQALVDAGETLTDEQEETLEEWEETLEDAYPPPEKIEKTIEAMRGGYPKVFAHLAPLVAEYQGTGVYNWGFYDMGGLMILGMALMKLGVLTGERPRRFYVLLVVLGYGIGIPVNLYETRLIIDSGFDHVAYVQSFITYDLGRIPTTCGHIGLIMLVFQAGWLRGLMGALAAVGRTALSNYVLHSVLCMFVFTGVGLGLFGRLQRYELYYVVAAIYLVNLLASPLWLRRYRFGPLEWCWRSLTYWSRQPMRRT